MVLEACEPSASDVAILLVDSEPDVLRGLGHALRGFHLVTANSGEDALAQLRSRRIDLVLSGYRMPGMTGIELLSICATEFADTKRLLMTAYEDLAEVVHAQGSEVASHVIPKPIKSENVRKLVEVALGVATGSGGESLAEPCSVEPPTSEEHLLEWTARQLASVDNVVIRPHQVDDGSLQLQFVLHDDDNFEAFRTVIRGRWGEPLKPRHVQSTQDARRHPVVKHLGGLNEQQELFVQAVEETTLYLALLPWEREGKLTVILGLHGQESNDEYSKMLLGAHTRAIHELMEFRLPEFSSQLVSEPGGSYSLDYDWVITKNYVGPDRRKQPTPFLGRFTIRGRRRKVSAALPGTALKFVDRLSPRALRLLGFYVFLSLIDTSLTYAYVSAEGVTELNPLMRMLLESSPLAFTFAKNIMSLLAILVVSRFELTRLGFAVLVVNVMIYLTLDLYWVWLLASP